MPTSMGWGTISFTTRSSAQNCQIDFLESRNQSRVVSHRRCTTLSICSTTREIRIDRMKMATRLIGCRSIGMGTMASRKVHGSMSSLAFSVTMSALSAKNCASAAMMTCFGEIYNWLFFYNGYHAEHHFRPKVHWTKMEKFRRNIVDLQKQEGVRTIRRAHMLGFLDPDLPKRREGRRAKVEAIELNRPRVVR